MDKKKYLKQCSFCGLGDDKVLLLICGPEVSICDDCLRVANEVHQEKLVVVRGRDTHTPQTTYFKRYTALSCLRITGMAELVIVKMVEQKNALYVDVERFVRSITPRHEEGVIDLNVLYETARGYAGLEEVDVACAVADVWGVSWYALRHTHISRLATHIMNQSLCERVKGFPVRVVNGELEVAVADPSLNGISETVKTHTGYDVKLAVATPTDIADAISRCYIQDWEVGISHDPALKQAMNRVYEKQPS